jgi:hypothetical protein
VLPVSWIGEFSLGAALTGSTKDYRTGEVQSGLGPWATFEAHVLYGVPGTPGLRLDHPFDHFSLDFSLSASPDRVEPALSFFTRALIVGDTIGKGDGFGGLWGLFTSYDFFAARLFRVTGFGLGPGVSLSKRWTDVNLLATGLVEFVPWAGAGETIPLGSRDYDYGIGGEGLLALRLDLGRSLFIRTSLREFLVSDSYSRGRSEDITFYRLGVWFRIWGPHAIGLESDWSRRNAQTERGPIFLRGWVLTADYTVLSGW